MTVDHTSSLYSLVVLATATLGIGQYVRINFSEEIKQTKEAVDKAWSSTYARIRKNKKECPTVTEEYEAIMNIEATFNDFSIKAMYVLLVFAAVLQLLNVSAKTYDFSAGAVLWLGRGVLLTYIVQICLMIWTGFNLYKLSRSRDNINGLSEGWHPKATAALEGMGANGKNDA